MTPIGCGFKAAVIGCGMAGRGHAEKAQSLGLEVVGFGDQLEEAAERARMEFGGRYATTDTGRIMRDDSIDVVLIATHHDAHHPLAIAAAEAGKHILLEKPMCLTYAQAVEVAEAVEKAGVKCVINCKFRIAPAVRKVRQLFPRPRVSHGQLAMRESENIGNPWVWRADDGGGLLISTTVHTIDLLGYLMDSAADRVYAEGRVFGDNKGTEGYPDALVGTILWKNGGLSTVISTDQGMNPFVSKWFLEIWDGERSAVLSADMNRADFSGCDVDHVDARELPQETQDNAAMMVNLIEAIRTDGDTLCDARDGVQAVAICNALDAAARTGTPQTVQ